MINRVNANADAASNICSQACVRLVVPKEDMTKEEEERFNVASNNGYKCAWVVIRLLWTNNYNNEQILKEFQNQKNL